MVTRSASLFVRCLVPLVWSVSSPLRARTSRASRSTRSVRYVALSFTTCASSLVRLPASRRSVVLLLLSKKANEVPEKGPFFVDRLEADQTTPGPSYSGGEMVTYSLRQHWFHREWLFGMTPSPGSQPTVRDDRVSYDPVCEGSPSLRPPKVSGGLCVSFPLHYYISRVQRYNKL